MMETRFYYLNEANEPVGPIDLEQMRKFRDAGIISESTLVCAEGSESWIALSSILEEPACGNSPPPVPSGEVQDEAAQNVGIVQICHSCGETFLLEENSDSSDSSCPTCGAAILTSNEVVRAWKRALWVSWLAVFFSYKLYSAAWFISLVPVLVAVGLEWRLLYKIWQMVPFSERTITPGRAFGFLLIPFFNIYWSFRMFRELARKAGGSRLLLVGTVVASTFLLIMLMGLIQPQNREAAAGFDALTMFLWTVTGYIFYAVVISRLSQSFATRVNASDFLPRFSKSSSCD